VRSGRGELGAFRYEVQNYIRSCEHLLSIDATPYNPPLTIDELQMVEYYVEEVAQMVSRQVRI